MPPQKKSVLNVRRLISATGYSLHGLRVAWRHETAFRQEVVLVLVLLPTALWLGTTMTQRAMLILPLLWLLVVELLNSAIEATVDRIGLEHHRLSGRAKDLGSAAVMICLVTTAVVWAMIAWERWA